MKDVILICVDAKNMPAEIPADKHLVKGNEYTLDKVVYLSACNRQAVSVKEIDLSDECYFPFHYWDLRRFKIKDDVKKEEALESTSALSSLLTGV